MQIDGEPSICNWQERGGSFEFTHGGDKAGWTTYIETVLLSQFLLPNSKRKLLMTLGQQLFFYLSSPVLILSQFLLFRFPSSKRKLQVTLGQTLCFSFRCDAGVHKNATIFSGDAACGDATKNRKIKPEQRERETQRRHSWREWGIVRIGL